ncbi:hypothetical protein GCM10007160_25420 [Litchfieldella qijiaojingensis]|uniref:Uncharacterized protein n=1 Tax=Litchfieldella qijiaojingensis TaxID=980347 RepID=A0ABQ2YX42_9GAMM|nr:hypothetical protein [Halomonas qijiaojingensis]GGX96712.1 hypothetical protein GCM10007160_25420 [Halomonas qijiaojingensis]
MNDTAVAAAQVSRAKFDNDLKQMELTQSVEALEALIDTVLRAGYLDDLVGAHPQVERVLSILNVCQEKAVQASELSRRCEEIWAGSANGP